MAVLCRLDHSVLYQATGAAATSDAMMAAGCRYKPWNLVKAVAAATSSIAREDGPVVLGRCLLLGRLVCPWRSGKQGRPPRAKK
jgi:hypothetical protein